MNFWDVMQRRGNVPLPPDQVPGVEGVGTVIEVGPNADAGLLGTRVAWSKVPSSYSTIVQGPADLFLPVPAEVTDASAAGALMQGITAQYLAEATTDLSPGNFAVVLAAAGGVGSLLVQYLRARGVHVIGVVGNEAKRAAAVTAGADHVLVDSDDLASEVRAIAPVGVEAVFDANGGDVSRLFALLRTRGIVVLSGASSGVITPIEAGALAAGSFYVTRTAGRDYAAAPGEWWERAHDVMTRVADGRLQVMVGGILGLAEASEAHERLENRLTTGKLLLAP